MEGQDSVQEPVTKPENAPIEMSKIHVDALVQYHHMAILFHVQCMTTYTSPFALDSETKSGIKKLKEASLHSFKKPVVFCDAFLKHIGEQVKNWISSKDEVEDVTAYIQSGHPIYLKLPTKGNDIEVNMSKVLALIESDINKQVDKKTINYAMFCKNIVLLSLFRIIKLAIEYDLPDVSHIMCKKVGDLERLVDDPYKMVDKSISPNMRQTTQAMGEVIYNIGNTLISNADADKDISLDSGGVECISGFLNNMAPKIKQVYCTLNQILEGDDKSAMNEKVTNTLSSFVSMNISSMMGDRIETLGDQKVDVDRVMSEAGISDAENPPCQKKCA